MSLTFKPWRPASGEHDFQHTAVPWSGIPDELWIGAGIAMPLYERGDVRIRYEEAGSGFPLLVVPGQAGRDVRAPEFLARMTDVSMEQIKGYLHELYRVQPNF